MDPVLYVRGRTADLVLNAPLTRAGAVREGAVKLSQSSVISCYPDTAQVTCDLVGSLRQT